MSENINKLHNFIANNYDLESLEAKLNEFNPLKVLKVDRYEIRHSNIISWLLNPTENHNLGNSFIKKFLSEIIINNENLDTDYDIFKIQQMSFHDFEIRREWKNIDIFLLSPTNKLAIIIENKIYASESEGQLDKYLKYVHSKYDNYEIIPVFLTLNGEIASNDRYGTISYSQIFQMLEFIISLQKENLSSKVYDFIKYYLSILEIMTMKDEEVKDLCKKIYKEHKQALDLIYEYAENTEFEEAAKEFFVGLNPTKVSTRVKMAWFIPSQIASVVKKVGEKSWFYGYPIAFWYSVQEEKLGITLEVGPFIDGSLRKRFLKHLQKYDFKIHDRSFKAGSKYTRIFSHYPKFTNWDDKESIIQKMDDLYNKSASKSIAKLQKACATFKWE